MLYDKPPLLFENQVDQLIDRGLEGERDVICKRIASVNYYRLSGYLIPYKMSDGAFYPCTKFETIWNHYAFDRRLRLLVLDAIERIEIAVRTQLAYHHAHTYNNGFAYAELPESLPGLKLDERANLLNRIRSEKVRSKDIFVSHFDQKYGNKHHYLPIWMAVETMSLGTIQRLFKGSSNQVKRKTADYFGMPHVVFKSWLHTLSVIRNQCAHHGRLWNKELGVRPLIPRQNEYPAWHMPVLIGNNRIFGVLTICRYCLQRIAPQSSWSVRLMQLIKDFPDVSIRQMGFPDNWRDSLLWKKLD